MNLSLSKMCLRKRRRSREAGIALVSVLWVLLLLSALAATCVYVSRTNALLARRTLDIARGRAAASAAIVDAISHLADERIDRHGPIDGTERSFSIDGIEVSVRVTEEAGRIDVNTDQSDLLLALLASQGVPQDRAGAMLTDLRVWASGIGTDYRSASMTKDLDANNRGLTSNSPLESVDELRRIPSWRGLELDCVANGLTVYTRARGINKAASVGPVTKALTWAQEHRMGDPLSAPITELRTTTRQPTSVVGAVLRIVAHATANNVVSVTEWVGRITGRREAPTLSMRWNQDSPLLSTACQL